MTRKTLLTQGRLDEQCAAAKAAWDKKGFSEELIEEATGYAETDDEEIINARKTFRELNDKYKEEIRTKQNRCVRQAVL